MFELIALLGHFLVLAIKLEKYVGLAAEDVRFDGLKQEIDRARLVAPEAPLSVRGSSREEDDRDALGASRSPHQLRQFKAVHVRHMHVDQRKRHVVLEQELQRSRRIARGESPNPRA